MTTVGGTATQPREISAQNGTEERRARPSESEAQTTSSGPRPAPVTLKPKPLEIPVGAPEARKSPATSVTWSPDGRWLAIGYGDDQLSILVWDVEARIVARTLVLDPRQVRSVAWCPTAPVLAVAVDDPAVQLWDTQTGRLIGRLEGHNAPVRRVAWSPDGKTLASGGQDETIRIWDRDSKQEARRISGDEAGIRDIAWSPDRAQLAMAEPNRSVRTWNLASGELPEKRFDAGLGPLAWSPDATTLAADGRLIHRGPERASLVKGLAFSPAGDRVATWTHTATLDVAETRQSRPLLTLVPLPLGQSLVISPEGHYQGTPRVERSFVYVVRTERGQEMMTAAAFAKRFGWNNDPSRLALATRPADAD